MELLDGETLEQRWRRKERRLPLEETLAVADQVLDALAAAHDKGVVHRDLKPENLFLTRERVVKLLDFGIGRLKELEGVVGTTLSGATMGTPAFMAPEQARGRWEQVDGQTDLWALGATMFTLLTGAYVHEGQTVNETLALAVTQPARSIKELRPDLPPRAVALIDKALSYAKPQRFSDARAMQREVRLTYAALASGDVDPAKDLPVPAPEPSTVVPDVAPGTDPRLRQTTVRGVAASGLPAPLRDVWARPGGRRLVLGVGGGTLLLLLVLAARSCGSGKANEASVAAGVDVTPSATQPLPARSTLPVETPSAVAPQVSIDQLPREKQRKPSEARPVSAPPAPAKKDDPFARRR
jgi:serine/threonine protein kinase